MQVELDKMNAAMHALSVRAVPVYNDHEDHKAWPLPPGDRSKAAREKRSRDNSQQWSAVEADEAVMCTTKWQLYFYEKGTKAMAVGMMREGVERCLAKNVFEPQDAIKLFELEDEATPWRCLRLVFETRRGLVFKGVMRDIAGERGTIKITTNQPKNVCLYSLFSDNVLFAGTMADLAKWAEQHGVNEQEI
jgi:hypothetical protein